MRRQTGPQSGLALLTVLLILTLMTSMVIYMIEDEYLAVRRVSNHRDFEQIYQMMAGNEQWAVKVLERDMKENKTDHLNEVWNNLLPETKVNEGNMKAVVVDMQGRLNLNNLKEKNDPWYLVFQRLLRVLELDESLADSVLDWIDQDEVVSGTNGAEDSEYLLKSPPYRAANRQLGSVGELLWVEGFDEETIAVLAPHVAALPKSDTRVNVNTATVPVLRALTPDILGESAAESLVAGRGETGYESADDFLVMTELAGRAQKVAPLIATASFFFEVQGLARYGRLTGAIYSVLEKDLTTQQVKVVQRRRGFS